MPQADPDIGPDAGPHAGSATGGFVGRIPVRNLWLLMLYASDLFRARAPELVDCEEAPDDLPDLVAEFLAHHVERRLKRNLSSAYLPRAEVRSRARGRIDLLKTERGQLLQRGKVACRFEELTVDSARNRYVRAALEKVGRIVKSQALARRCRTLAVSLARLGVRPEKPDERSRAFASVDRFGRHDAGDRPMVAAAKLIFDLALPMESAGIHALNAPDRDVAWIRRLYEKAVAGFYGVTLGGRGWRVAAGRFQNWQVADQTPGMQEILPAMQTDVVLDPPKGPRIVIDTKFNALLTTGWHRKDSLRSGHLYQMYAYLRSQEGQGDSRADSASGLLLHPSVGAEIDESATIQGHVIRFATVNLADDAKAIRARLLELAGESAG